MGVTLARGLIGGLGVVLVVAGLVVAAAGPGGDVVSFLFLILPGVILIVAAVFERLRYRSLAADGPGDDHGPGGERAGAARAPIPADGRAVRRPDDRGPDARVPRPDDRRTAVRRGGLSRRSGAPNRWSSGAVRDRRRGILGGPTGIGPRCRRARVPGPVRIVARTMTAVRPAPGPRAAARGRRRSAREERHPILNRELSWLEFNARVLHEARRRAQPPPRPRPVPVLLRQQPRRVLPGAGLGPAAPGAERLAGAVRRRPDGRRPARRDPGPGAWSSSAEQGTIFANLHRELAAEGIAILDYDDVPDHHEALRQRFHDEIYPVLTPLAVDPGHPFPYISTLTLSIAVGLRDPDTGEQRFARVKIPPLLPRLVQVDPGQFVLLDQIIEANLDELFRGMEILETHLFRVTRDADIAIEEDEADDLLLAIEEEVRRRRFGEAVRLEVERSMPEVTRQILSKGVGVLDDDVLRGRRDARPHRPVAARRPRPPRPQGAAVHAGHPAAADAARGRRAGRPVRADPGRRPASCTTRTSRSRRPSSGSSRRRPTIPTS